METERILTIVIQAASFIATFAAITAAIVMSSVRKKFGTGILALGFRTIAIGVFFIALGIVLDSASTYLQAQGTISVVLLLVKESLFVIGTYIIVIGSKRTVDKLESLTK